MSHEPLTPGQLAACRVALNALGPWGEYDRIHYAARKVISPTCERCGVGERIQAALRPDADPSSLRVDPKTGCLYSLDLASYGPLCVTCHRYVDLVVARDHCKHGHEYTPENTSVKPDGSRRCLTCHSAQARARLADPAARSQKYESDRAWRAANPMTERQKERKVDLQRQRRAAARFEHGESG